MRDRLSRVVHFAAWLAVILTALSLVLWIAIIADGNYVWSAFAFSIMALPLGGGIFVLGIIPSTWLFLRHRRREDLRSLWLAGGSLAILVVAVVSLQLLPMRGE